MFQPLRLSGTMRSPAMKICPTCKRRYSDSLQFCLEDGTVLEPLRESEPTLVDPQATLRLTPRETNPPSAPARRGNMLILFGVGGVVAVAVVAVIAVILIWQLGSKTGSSPGSNTNQNPHAPSAVEMRSTAEIITDTNNQVGIALLNGDADALSRILADDYR